LFTRLRNLKPRLETCHRMDMDDFGNKDLRRWVVPGIAGRFRGWPYEVENLLLFSATQ
jgi:hypothetical protein